MQAMASARLVASTPSMRPWESLMMLARLFVAAAVIGLMAAAQTDDRLLRLEAKSESQAERLVRIETKLEVLSGTANAIAAGLLGLFLKEAGAALLFFVRKKGNE